MSPDNGGRLNLVLKGPRAESTVYNAELRGPEGVWAAEIVIASGGEVLSGPWSGGEPPDWLLKFTLTFLKTHWRNHQGGTPWPRRITRWRAEPKARRG